MGRVREGGGGGVEGFIFRHVLFWSSRPVEKRTLQIALGKFPKSFVAIVANICPACSTLQLLWSGLQHSWLIRSGKGDCSSGDRWTKGNCVNRWTYSNYTVHWRMTFLLSTAASPTSLSVVIHSVVITTADKALFNGLLVSAPCGDISHCSALKCHVHEDTIHQQVIFTTTAEV